MNSILQRNTYFVKEHIGFFKAANNFDIYSPENQELIMNCREDSLGFFTKMFRFTDYKRMTPFHIEIKTPDGKKVLTVKRGVTIFRSVVEVLDENDMLVGKFRQKFFSIGGKFAVLDTNDNEVCRLKGSWTSWDFAFVQNDRELARVNKKWAGIGKELFTSADNYMLTVNESVPASDPTRILILAAVMCIDMVLKE
ncbi:MAG: RNAase [Bacteroidetes bacterium]|jgi:uncharacterized protein YxjI|nr:RNAase [Bacteroidota bacterium]